MEIKESTATIRTLIPSDGHMLIKGPSDAPDRAIIASRVILGAGDSAANWREIPAAEAEAIINAQQQNDDDQPQDQ